MKRIIISFMFYYSIALHAQLPPPKIGDIEQCSDELIKEILKFAQRDTSQDLHTNIISPGRGITRSDEELKLSLKEKLNSSSSNLQNN